MAAPSTRPAGREPVDERARRTALTAHDRSILVEAGAGSGKTAILAGRIAGLLAAGAAPRHIAAVTFTELAASELLARVREFVIELARGRVPPMLRGVFPQGVPASARLNLSSADTTMDEITCTTIHGFCERLIAPYPVEAGMDPGARVMDRDEMEIVFEDFVDAWLDERLSAERGGLLDELVRRRPRESIELIRELLKPLRQYRRLTHSSSAQFSPHIATFRREVAAFATVFERAAVPEPETATIVALFQEMSAAVTPLDANGDSAAIVELLTWTPHPELCRDDGAFKVLRKKGRWVEAAKRAGIGKSNAEQLYGQAEDAYRACCDSWTRVRQIAAGTALAALITELQPVVQRFQEYKRSAALLDFDDLIHIACSLLRDHDEVRRALARRYAHVLVDEFQDTDLLQVEILWRLCGDLGPGAAGSQWMDLRIRPGALFLVGDPKQAIYRFRGADVAAYLRAREAFLARGADHVLSISTNFRSCEPILQYVNDRFRGPLSATGQPGFTPLDPFNEARDDVPCVTALDIKVADEDGKASAERLRRVEAEAVAHLCVGLIGEKGVVDRKTGIVRPCRAGDIALLAPAGTDLWRYEEALEQCGIPVTTQAGKGLFRRQEIQDLIAVTRVLADPRDTLGLGALLRGPLVGLTEEELLDIVWSLPRASGDTSAIPRLDVRTDLREISHPLARDILARLQSLRRHVKVTTPHAVLAQAVEALCVRPILRERHRRHAERALANVDLYLDLSRAYAVRGLRAFAQAMSAAWKDESRALEGRPDTQEDAVTLHTMHAAKGLEWPIVIPINTVTAAHGPDNAIVDRSAGQLHCRIFGAAPVGYETIRDAEKTELEREHMRLWYVALTRAREMLVVPRPDVAPAKSAWGSVLDLALAQLPTLELPQDSDASVVRSSEGIRSQSREVFEEESSAIRRRHRALSWIVPSREEDTSRSDESESVFDISDEGASLPGEPPVDDRLMTTAVRGSRERGVIIHKLLEEVLNGEIGDDAEAIVERARALIRTLGRGDGADPSRSLSAMEIGSCVIRTLALPEIAALRPTLIPEVPVYALLGADGGEERAIVGIVDALSVDEDGTPRQIIDWKSDIDPTAEALAGYRAQLGAYLQATGVRTALLVFVTSGAVLPITSAASLTAGIPPPAAFRSSPTAETNPSAPRSVPGR